MIKRLTGKMVLAVFIVCLLFQSAGNIVLAQNEVTTQAQEQSPANNLIATPLEVAHEFTNEMQLALDGAQGWLLKQNKISDWTAIGLARNGIEVPSSYRFAKGDEVLTNRGSYEKMSDLALSIMGYTAAGANVTDIAGYNLKAHLVLRSTSNNEGADELALGSIAFGYNEESDYNRPNWYPDLWYYRITDLQLADGSYPKAGEKTGDIRSTMLALLATPSNENPSERKELSWIVAQQAEDGGYNKKVTDTSYAAIALTAGGYENQLSIDNSSALHKAIQFLLQHKLSSGAFAEQSGQSASVEATEQAYLALTAYKYWFEQEDLLYDWIQPQLKQVTVTVEGPNGLIARGYSSGYIVEDAVQTFLSSKGIAYTTSNKTEQGITYKGITNIQSISNSKEQVWSYAVKGNTYADYEYRPYDGQRFLENADSILVYYGDPAISLYTTLGIKQPGQSEYGVSNEVSEANKSFYIQIQKQVFVANNAYKMKNAVGVIIELNGKKYTTNSNGNVQISGLPAGIYEIVISDPAKAFVTLRKQFIVRGPSYDAFTDAKQLSTWAQYDMTNALQYGIIKGTSTKPMMLEPKKQLTRAEFVMMLMRVLETSSYEPKKSYFSDIKTTQWYSNAINVAKELGITDATEGNFRPNAAITREEAAIMLAHAGQLQTFRDSSKQYFSDTTKLSKESLHAIQAVNEYRMMKGDQTGFRPKDQMTREEAATVAMRLYDYVNRYKQLSYSGSVL